MVAFNRTAACWDAEPHYYDYLCGMQEAVIPPAVIEHIEQCAYCRAQIRQLEAALADCDANDQQRQRDAGLIDLLNRQFYHVGEDFTCAKAKPFLPTLLLPSLEIRIPTPATVHVNHCGPCREDLEAIRRLELRPEQLVHLNRLYRDRPDPDRQMCRRARSKIHEIAWASTANIETEILDHVCTCSRCRALLYRHRERLASNRHPTIANASHVCPGVAMADLFDYAVPYRRPVGRSPQATAEEKAIISHVQVCPECIEKIQALHRTIYGVADRADSGISTIYTTDRKSGEHDKDTENLYKDYPISVKVVHRGRRLAVRRFRPVARVEAAIQRARTHPQFKPVFKAALLTAAMIPLAIVFLISSQTASGITARQIANSIRSVKNLHVIEYGGNRTEFGQEFWIARDRRLVVRRNASGDVLYDLDGHRMIIVEAQQKALDDVPLNAKECEHVQEMIDDILGFRATGIPVDKEFECRTSDGNEVHELTWVEGSSSSEMVVQRRLVVILDTVTRLPSTIEGFRRRSDEQQWHRVSKMIFAYPSPQAIDSVVEQMFSSGRSFGAPEGTVAPFVLAGPLDE